MDIELIRARQDSIARCVQRIRTKADLPFRTLVDDYDAQDVVVLNLERAIQQAVDIATHLLSETAEPVPETMRAAFDALHRITRRLLAGEGDLKVPDGIDGRPHEEGRGVSEHGRACLPAD